MTLNVDALACLKVKELQRELKKRGLDTSGLKAVLLERLQERLQQEEALETHKDETQETEEEETTEVSDSQEKQEEALKKECKLEKERGAENDGRDDKNETSVGIKRAAEAIEDQEMAIDTKKPKISETKETNSPQPEDEDGGKSVSPSDDAEADSKAEGDAAMNDEKTLTIRIDNFVRPFTLNAVKELVQEFGSFVEEGFWMDAIKTHCFVTYCSSEIAEKARSALDGKVWPPENGRSLGVKLVNCTAMEVAQHGEANIPDRSKSKNSCGTQSAQRPKVTIDEFFQKTETKPVLYYLPLTDEQIKQKKERRGQQPEGPRKRRHRGGRKRNKRARFRRR
ncbi:unnamed protein product [Peronospora destructor]|uniref:SAP domain-containing protein n=1 Tax=Peronospora destructor TaxID=86335 RepID=A0AAV0V5I2_9STRA|nr:unnamed protein product [Peronospora destructor]